MSKLLIGAITGAIAAAQTSNSFHVVVEEGTIHAYKFETPREIELLSLYAIVHDENAGGIFRIGVYSNVEADDAWPICPKTLMVESGDLSAAMVGQQDIVWSTPRPMLPAGEYWLAVWAKIGNIDLRGQKAEAMPVLGGGSGSPHGMNHFIIPHMEIENPGMPADLQDAMVGSGSTGSGTVAHLGLYKNYMPI